MKERSGHFRDIRHQCRSIIDDLTTVTGGEELPADTGATCGHAEPIHRKRRHKRHTLDRNDSGLVLKDDANTGFTIGKSTPPANRRESQGSRTTRARDKQRQKAKKSQKLSPRPLASHSFSCGNNNKPSEPANEYYPLDRYYKGGGIEGYTNLTVESNDKTDSRSNKEITPRSYSFLDHTKHAEKCGDEYYSREKEMEKFREQSLRFRKFAADSLENFRKKTAASARHRSRKKDRSAGPKDLIIVDDNPFPLAPISYKRANGDHEINGSDTSPGINSISMSSGLSLNDKASDTITRSRDDLLGQADTDQYAVRRIHSLDDMLEAVNSDRRMIDSLCTPSVRNDGVPPAKGNFAHSVVCPTQDLKVTPAKVTRQRKLGTVSTPNIPNSRDLSKEKDESFLSVGTKGEGTPPKVNGNVRVGRRRGRKNRDDPRWKSEPLAKSLSADDFGNLREADGSKDEKGRNGKRSVSLMDLFRSSISLSCLFCWSKSAKAAKEGVHSKGIPSERSGRRQNESHPVRRVTVGEPPTSSFHRERPPKMLSARSVSEGLLNVAHRNNNYKPLVAENDGDQMPDTNIKTEHRPLRKSLMRISSSDHGATNPVMFRQALARTGDAVLFLQGPVQGESSTDPPTGDLDQEVDSYMGQNRSDSVFSSTDADPLLAPRDAVDNDAVFDITGPSGNIRFAWQRDIGVQCTILRGDTPRRRSDVEDSPGGQSPPLYSDPMSMPRKTPLSGPTRSLDSITMMDAMSRHRRHMSEVVPPPSPRIRELQEQNPLFQRRRAITLSDSDIELFNETHNSPGTKKKRKNSKKGKNRTYQRACSLPSPVPTMSTTPTNAVFGHENKTFEEEASLDKLPTDLGARSDTLSSPSVSPVPWLTHSVPELVVTRSSTKDQIGSTSTLSSGRSEKRLSAENFLRVPPRRITVVDIPIISELKPADVESGQSAAAGSAPSSPFLPRSLRRNSSGSLHSASDDSDTEPTTPPIQRRGRRQAIFDSKSLASATGPEGDLSPANSCDESEASHPPAERLGRKRSSVDLGINYPGDLLVQSRQKKVLIKRNTIADFANTKAYQASTASLISEQGDSKKIKSTFSLLKLIDKKSHRSKDNLTSLSEVLQNLSSRPSTFHSHLSMYKDVHWSELIASKDKETTSSTNSLEGITENERKRREAVWEFFMSECVFLIDHLMVLKHCFMEPMKKVQVEGHMMFAEPNDLFGNLDELCFVSHTFCRDFISLLLKDARAQEFGRTEVLVKALQMFCQLTRDGEVYHDYCLNYSKACTYLEQLRKNEDFCDFEKWCEQDSRCHRLQLSDLLISPMQHCTKVPLLLTNIRKYTEDPDERQQLTDSLEKLEASLQSLEEKMKWLKNFERVQEIQQQIVWQPITELEPRAFIPEVLKNTLNRQPCERLLASPKRQLLHEGPLTLLEISKTIDMYMFLFDDILLLTKVKKQPRKKSSVVDPSNPQNQPQTDGAVFTVHRQPIALDRFTIHDVRPPDATGFWEYVECGVYMPLGVEPKEGMAAQLMEDYNPQRSNLFFGCLSAANGLRNAFVLVQISRFQQIIGVYTLQAPNEQAKTMWMNKLHEAQDQYKEASSRNKRRDSEKSPDKDRGKDRKDSTAKQKSPKPSGSRSPRPSSPSQNDRHRHSADSTSSDEQYRRISNASTVSTVTIKSTGSGFIDESAQIEKDSEGGQSGAEAPGSRLAVDEAGGKEQPSSSSPTHSPGSRGRRLSPSRLQKLTMLKAIHEKSQSIDAVYI